MSENDTIRGGIQYVQGIFKQLSVLLLTADEIVGEREFGSAYGNICIEDMAVKVTDPSKWVPNALFRFYQSDQSPRVLLFVSVLLDDRYNEYDAMNECLLTAGAFVHKGEMWDNKWRVWWARWHGFQEGRRDDGSVMCSETKDWPDQKDDETKAIEKLFTVGVPLPTMTGAEQLKAFLAPLFKAIEPYRSSAPG